MDKVLDFLFATGGEQVGLYAEAVEATKKLNDCMFLLASSSVNTNIFSNFNTLSLFFYFKCIVSKRTKTEKAETFASDMGPHTKRLNLRSPHRVPGGVCGEGIDGEFEIANIKKFLPHFDVQPLDIIYEFGVGYGTLFSCFPHLGGLLHIGHEIKHAPFIQSCMTLKNVGNLADRSAVMYGDSFKCLTFDPANKGALLTE
jgi:hypothetical protein